MMPSRFVRPILYLTFFVTLLVSPREALAQSWLPVSPDDLAMKDNPQEPGADAMILYRQNIVDARHASYSGDSDEEYVRIKIFTQEGTKEGHVEVPFLKEGMEIKDVAGRTIKPDGTVVKFDGQVLQTTAVKYQGEGVLVKSFTLPDVTPGCIVEYHYRKQGLPGWVHSEEWTVSSDLFTREAHFQFWPDLSGGAPAPFYREIHLPKEVKMTDQRNGSFTLDINNVPAIVDEPLMPPKEALEMRVDFYYKDEYANAGEAPGPFWIREAKRWNAEIDHFLDKKTVLAAEVAKITSPSDDPETKLRKIYARVLQVRNLSMEEQKSDKEMKAEALKADANVEDLLNRNAGNERQINFLYVGLARAAGFQSAEIYLAPRTGDDFDPGSEDPSQLAADIVWVQAGGKDYYLDPGARYYPFGILPWFETDAAGIRITERDPGVLGVPQPIASDAVMTRTAHLTVADDASVSGTLELDFAGRDGAMLRTEKRKEDETGRTKDIEEEVRQWLPVGATFEISKIENWDDVEKPVHVVGTVKIPTFASGSVRNMLMPREIFQATEPAGFVAQKRSNMVYFDFPYQQNDDITFTAPLGYAFQGLPKDQKVDLKAVEYDVTSTQQNGVAEVKRHLEVNGEVFKKENYPVLRNFFGIVKSDDAAGMILANAQSAHN